MTMIMSEESAEKGTKRRDFSLKIVVFSYLHNPHGMETIIIYGEIVCMKKGVDVRFSPRMMITF